MRPEFGVNKTLVKIACGVVGCGILRDRLKILHDMRLNRDAHCTVPHAIPQNCLCLPKRANSVLCRHFAAFCKMSKGRRATWCKHAGLGPSKRHSTVRMQRWGIQVIPYLCGYQGRHAYKEILAGEIHMRKFVK